MRDQSDSRNSICNIYQGTLAWTLGKINSGGENPSRRSHRKERKGTLSLQGYHLALCKNTFSNRRLWKAQQTTSKKGPCTSVLAKECSAGVLSYNCLTGNSQPRRTGIYISKLQWPSPNHWLNKWLPENQYGPRNQLWLESQSMKEALILGSTGCTAQGITERLQLRNAILPPWGGVRPAM